MNTNISFFERKSYKESGKKEENFDKVKQVHKKREEREAFQAIVNILKRLQRRKLNKNKQCSIRFEDVSFLSLALLS